VRQTRFTQKNGMGALRVEKAVSRWLNLFLLSVLVFEYDSGLRMQSLHTAALQRVWAWKNPSV
jgi:hypothetical protein